jgi:NAD(P)H dehydrogenase (quinone)
LTLRALIVLAHPLQESLCAHLARRAEAAARAAGWEVTVRDLYKVGFDPRLTLAERRGYYGAFQGEAQDEMAELAGAQVLILVFPTWWFGFPAILKGWIDRVWAPGLAYDHSPQLKQLEPRLTGLREVLGVTTMGAPGWFDTLVMWRPVARVLRLGVVRPCAPQARTRLLRLGTAEKISARRLQRFEAQLDAALAAMAQRLR